jgi:rhamnopyranosyl-N-acetylglucosaminyl-diphospho-decaprenol beta-1,3/1,4-galactofuranosyltransferase
LEDRVFAVVVSYNRKDLLRQCLAALLAQTHPLTDIVVVNNASTDGTRDMLEAEFPDRVHRIHMTHNVGGAGGFYQGVKWAFDHGADWLWLSDDDGIPDADALDRLLLASRAPDGTRRYEVLNPLVLVPGEPEQLSFGMTVGALNTMSLPVLKAAAGDAEVFDDEISPFNGTLIHRDGVAAVGLPKREMFIWGDEVDYTARLRKAGMRMGTVLGAIHRHPAAKARRINLGFLGSVEVIPPPRIGIAARNVGYIHRQHRDWRLKFVKPLIVCAYHLLSGSPRNCANFLRYYLDGYHDRYRLDPPRQQFIAQGDVFTVALRRTSPANAPYAAAAAARVAH